MKTQKKKHCAKGWGRGRKRTARSRRRKKGQRLVGRGGKGGGRESERESEESAVNLESRGEDSLAGGRSVLPLGGSVTSILLFPLSRQSTAHTGIKFYRCCSCITTRSQTTTASVRSTQFVQPKTRPTATTRPKTRKVLDTAASAASTSIPVRLGHDRALHHSPYGHTT